MRRGECAQRATMQLAWIQRHPALPQPKGGRGGRNGVLTVQGVGMDRARLKAIPAVYRLYQLCCFLLFQPQRWAAAVRDHTEGLMVDGLPLPPAKLRHRVHGALDRESFLRLGQVVSRSLHDLVGRAGRRLDSFESILDFGCGSGRVLRFLTADAPRAHFHATDIDPEPIAWGRQHMPGITWSSNGFTPPLPYPDASFDLIYAISVFSHLDETFQNAWLCELERVARPGAIVILTTHGERLAHALAPSEQARLEADGILFCTGATGRLKLDGLPDFYQSTFHKRSYIDQVWGRHFQVVDYVEGAIDDYQDAAVLRKRAAAAPAAP